MITRSVIMIESVAELPALSDLWIRLTEATRQISGDGAFSLEQVAKETLRLRPETFVVGELRGGEAEVFVDLSLCGHGGCLATIHASSVESATLRLRKLAPRMTASLPQSWEVAVVLLERHKASIQVKTIEVTRFPTN